MADPVKKLAFVGFAGDAQAFTSVFINPETDPLNEAGQKAFENHKKNVDPEATELEVRLYLPYPSDGFANHVEPAFLAEYKAAYKKWAAEKGCEVEFDLDKWILGQLRIDVNRDTLTPKAYELFTVAKVKNSPKKAKAKASKKEETSKVVAL